MLFAEYVYLFLLGVKEFFNLGFSSFSDLANIILSTVFDRDFFSKNPLG
jgi:hypothetical protein